MLWRPPYGHISHKKVSGLQVLKLSKVNLLLTEIMWHLYKHLIKDSRGVPCYASRWDNLQK